MGEVYSEDKEYCEWVCHQEATNVHMIEFGRIIQQVDARWEDHNREVMMKELEEGERRLRANRMAMVQEVGEKVGKETDGTTEDDGAEMVDDARQVKKRHRGSSSGSSTVAAAKKAEGDTEEQDKTSTKQDTMAAGEPNEHGGTSWCRGDRLRCPEVENETGTATKTEAGDTTSTI